MRSAKTPIACAALGMLLAACSTADIHFELPALDGAKSILFILSENESAEAFAYNLDALPPVRLSADRTPIRARVLVYSDPLEELTPSLAEGRLTTVLDEAGRTLPRADRMFEATVKSAKEALDWNTADQDSIELRLPKPETPCVTFEVADSFDLEATSREADVQATVALGPARALLGARDSSMPWEDYFQFFLIEPSPDRRPQAVPVESHADLPSLALFSPDDETIWFGGFSLWQGRVTETGSISATLRDPRRPMGTRLRNLAGVREPPTLFGSFENGELGRWTGDSLERLATFSDATEAPRIAALGPDELVAVMEWRQEILRYKDGQSELELAFETDAGEERLVKHLEGVGTVVGAAGGRVAFQPEGDTEWMDLKVPGFDLRVSGLAAWPNGFLVLGQAGFVAQYDLDFGFCEARVLGSGTLKALLPFDDSFLLIAADLFDADGLVVRVSPD